MDSKSQSLVPTMAVRIKSENLSKEMDVVGHFCPNPECLCKDATLYFYEADSSFNIKLFKLVINYETWQLISTEIYKDDEDYAKIIHEFMDELDTEMKSMILSGKEHASSDKHVLRDDIDYSGLEIDSMVCYPEIYRVPSYEQWIIEHDNTEYFVLDYYCPNPRCDCMDALLTFQIVKNRTACDTPVLEYRIKFRTGKRIVEKKDASISAQLAEDLFAKFLERLGERGVGLLEERYYRIKKWGKDYLQRKRFVSSASLPSVGPKIGRNSPCPCGSGKKYKKCCGQ